MLPTSPSELAFPSTGSWFPSRLSSTWRWAERIERIFSDSKSAKKSDILSEKRDGTKKTREFTPKGGNADTYESLFWLIFYCKE